MARKKKVHKGLRAARDKVRAGEKPSNLADIKARRKLSADELTLQQHRGKQAESNGKPKHQARQQENTRRDRRDEW